MVLEADANRSLTLRILDKTLSFRDHTVSLDKTQPKKKEPEYANKKNTFPYKPYTNQSRRNHNSFRIDRNTKPLKKPSSRWLRPYFKQSVKKSANKQTQRNTQHFQCINQIKPHTYRMEKIKNSYDFEKKQASRQSFIRPANLLTQLHCKAFRENRQ